MGEGFLHLKSDLLRVIVYPFGELFIFILFFQFLPKYSNRRIYLNLAAAVIIGTLYMIIVDVVIVGTLGAHLTKNLVFPFYSAMRFANIQGLSDRLDPFSMIIAIYTAYYKGILYFYATASVLTSLNKKFNFIWLLVFGGIINWIFAPFISLLWIKFYNDFIVANIMPVFLIILPMIIWLISEWRNYNEKLTFKGGI
jgi:spore germination protein KB